MHLVSCTTPPGSLEAAPRTALLAEPSASDGEQADQWDGFWCAQTDAYYARCTHRDGEVEWFSLADDETDAAAFDDERAETVLRAAPLSRRASESSARVAVIVARSPDGRGMLVGSGRRGRRA